MEKGLRVSVFCSRRSPKGSTNGGISSDFDSFTLVGVDGPSEPNMTSPAIYLKQDFNGIRGNTVAVPSLTDGKWYMFGGNFIYSSDSRFPSRRPIPIHDRTETQEESDMLSR